MQNPVAANDNFPAVIDPLLPLRAVRAATGQGSSTIYRKMAIGAFPRPLQIGPGSVRWRTSEIIAWIDGIPRAA
jgi:prophage regulatory protein